MKQINKALLTVLFFVAAGSASAASVEHETVVYAKAPTVNMALRQAAFQQVVSRHVDRVIEMQLDYQGDLVVANMYEAPTVVSPIEIEIQQHL